MNNGSQNCGKLRLTNHTVATRRDCTDISALQDDPTASVSESCNQDSTGMLFAICFRKGADMRKREIQHSTVVITGASSGIGQAAALAFARQGSNLVLASRGVYALE